MNQKTKRILPYLAIVTLMLILLFKKHPAVSQNPNKGEVAETNISAQTQVTNTPARTPVATPVTNEFQKIEAHMEQVKQEDERIIGLARSPIIYYGKVVDESNQPISGVHVTYTAQTVNETPEDVFNPGSVTSDERGIFKIDGINGIGLILEISHPDYYPYPENSTGFDKRSRPRDGIVEDSEAHARVFRMHHKGNPVPLVSHEGGLHKPADGTLMDFILRGKSRDEIIGHLQIQGWKGEADPQNSGHYDWKVQITVPDGGIIESTNEFDFIAPETGYKNTLSIGFSKDDPAWQAYTQKSFFFKLPNYFIRGQAYIDLYHDLYFSMNYLVNPDGSTNLEPAK